MRERSPRSPLSLITILVRCGEGRGVGEARAGRDGGSGANIAPLFCHIRPQTQSEGARVSACGALCIIGELLITRLLSHAYPLPRL